MLTMQALDGMGLISLLASPVTSALGQANVRSIESARQIVQQQQLAYTASFVSV